MSESKEGGGYDVDENQVKGRWGISKNARRNKIHLNNKELPVCMWVSCDYFAALHIK